MWVCVAVRCDIVKAICGAAKGERWQGAAITGLSVVCNCCHYRWRLDSCLKQQPRTPPQTHTHTQRQMCHFMQSGWQQKHQVVQPRCIIIAKARYIRYLKQRWGSVCMCTDYTQQSCEHSRSYSQERERETQRDVEHLPARQSKLSLFQISSFLVTSKLLLTA